MTRGLIFGLLAALLLAVLLRCPELGRRPMHNDEAVNAIKFRELWQQGSYRYDPNEHHGPALPYFMFAWAKLTGGGDFANFTEARLRGVSVLFGIGLILLLPLVADGLGRNATIGAGIFTAISPALVYYSRDYIHEPALVFFTLLTLAGAWRYSQSRKLGWALLAGAGVGLMQSTKETFVLALAAIAVATTLNFAWSQFEASSAPRKVSRHPWHFWAAIGVWAAIAVLFFSSFFTQPDGPLDAFRTYLPWMHRAAGDTPHNQPWHFYLSRLAFFQVNKGPIWSEGLILGLALAGLVASLTRKGPSGSNAIFLRFLALYTLALTVIYSLITYKTPWCLLGFWHGFILLAGVGAVVCLQQLRARWLKISATAVLVAGCAQLAAQAWLASVQYCADRRNPYVYAQTSPDVLELVEQVNALGRIYPQGRAMLVKVIAPGDDYWPLPWYLRAFDHVGWWGEMPDDPFAPAMIVSTRLNADLEDRGTHVMAGLFELRPGAFFELYVQSDLWQAWTSVRALER